ncbi:hypothetical protein GCM10010844_34370 [Deinococcus radiotolerans]|uniref:Uncharacterized protein n=2 Tax=Deinococcus radiotolerans TaxID=1309407 RepID=A0ABQ2FNY2_9DEIO|nr:hypothetical protein GCM10010844_34370 [Deinococcus radiotolerans]
MNPASFSLFRDEAIRLLTLLRPHIAFSCSYYNQFGYNAALSDVITPSKYYDTLFAQKDCFKGEDVMIKEFYDFQYVDDYVWISSPRRLGDEAPYNFPDIDGRNVTDHSLQAVLDQAQARHEQAFRTTIRLPAL